MTTIPCYHLILHTMPGGQRDKRALDANDIVSIIKPREWSGYVDFPLSPTRTLRYTPETGEKLVPVLCAIIASNLTAAHPPPFP